LDPHASDAFGKLQLSSAGLKRRNALVFSHAKQAGAHVVVTTGGGYPRISRHTASRIDMWCRRIWTCTTQPHQPTGSDARFRRDEGKAKWRARAQPPLTLRAHTYVAVVSSHQHKQSRPSPLPIYKLQVTQSTEH
jgi:hypothetical protein